MCVCVCVHVYMYVVCVHACFMAVHVCICACAIRHTQHTYVYTSFYIPSHKITCTYTYSTNLLAIMQYRIEYSSQQLKVHDQIQQVNGEIEGVLP